MQKIQNVSAIAFIYVGVSAGLAIVSAAVILQYATWAIVSRSKQEREDNAEI